MSAISGYSSSNSYTQSTSMASLKERTFKAADSSGDGSIDSTEFEDFISKGPDGSTADASAMFAKFDTDGDGSISADEMDTGMQSLHSQMQSTMNQMKFGGGHGGTPPSMDDLFSKADSGSDGSVDSTEFADFLSKGPQANSVNAEEAFASYDTDSDGTLSSDEFSAGMKDLMSSMSPPPPPPPPSGNGGQEGSGKSSSSAQSILSQLDSDGDGVIDSEELTSGLSNTQIQKMIASYIQQMSSSYSTQTSSLLTSVSA